MANTSKTTSTLIIGESPATRTGVQYARPPANRARASRRQVAILGGILLAFLLPAFISFGMWQWNKAETKTAIQKQLDSRSRDLPIAMPSAPVDAESMRFRRVVLRGKFDASRQTLIDNRLYREQAGYHVITPLRLDGSEMRVLINRGWVPASPDHQVLPEIGVPDGIVELTGIVVTPGQRFFNLAPQPTTGWTPVWQNLDLERFRQALPYPIQPLVVQLEADSAHGFVREWPRPDERAERHRSYALQWFGFAVASLGIWLWLLVRRP
jgi:surfeit locus 1 family protein